MTERSNLCDSSKLALQAGLEPTRKTILRACWRSLTYDCTSGRQNLRMGIVARKRGDLMGLFAPSVCFLGYSSFQLYHICLCIFAMERNDLCKSVSTC
jgi:hypothetical protein